MKTPLIYQTHGSGIEKIMLPFTAGFDFNSSGDCMKILHLVRGLVT